MWTAAIAAGGQARRLDGRDTGALRVGAASILERQLAMPRALTPNILRTDVNTPEDYEQST